MSVTKQTIVGGEVTGEIIKQLTEIVNKINTHEMLSANGRYVRFNEVIVHDLQEYLILDAYRKHVLKNEMEKLSKMKKKLFKN